eukprot:CAMPEP_0119069390 /NCGR_PEP_ID=MMETSP1178-20130426/17056_1 /TAXON_ID=33656 /ORGANISM="unid sp, Strain CCMP2000" /LENGTH=106 /DNA_ID=CAMNT_0007051147 /DNA_START=169 /DNA_END=489 /DNA_ORIENTATION=-
MQSGGQPARKVVPTRGLQHGGVAPHLGQAVVLLGVRLSRVVEPLDPLLVAACKEFPAFIRVEAAFGRLLLLRGGRSRRLAPAPAATTAAAAPTSRSLPPFLSLDHF